MIGREKRPAEGIQAMKPDPSVLYYLIFSTVNVDLAGTDSSIYIQLFGQKTGQGENGGSGWIHINPISSEGNFEQGTNTRVGLFPEQIEDLGPIRRIKIKKDTSGANPGWFLQTIFIHYKPWVQLRNPVQVVPSSTYNDYARFDYNSWMYNTEGQPVELRSYRPAVEGPALTQGANVAELGPTYTDKLAETPAGQDSSFKWTLTRKTSASYNVSSEKGEGQSISVGAGGAAKGVSFSGEYANEMEEILAQEETDSVGVEESASIGYTISMPPGAYGVAETHLIKQSQSGQISVKEGKLTVTQDYQVIKGVSGYFKFRTFTKEQLEAGDVSHADMARLQAMGFPPPADGPGQLKWFEVPGAPYELLTEHTVKKGETLSHISYKYYRRAVPQKWMILYHVNKDIIGSEPNFIRTGWVLKIPKLPNPD